MKDNNWLGASPDGIICSLFENDGDMQTENDYIIEVKWVAQKRFRGAKIKECVKNLANFCLE